MRASDLVNYTLRIAGILGVGQSPLAQDENDALAALVFMLAQWQRKRWLVYRLDEAVTKVTPTKASYTIGPDALPDGTPLAPDISSNTTRRPGSLEDVFLRQLSGGFPQSFPIDYPLRQIISREEWNAIGLKALGSWPGSWFYDPALPLGRLYVWPIPIQTFFELHVFFSQDIQEVTPSFEMETLLPLEAHEAIIYNLAARLRMNYALPPRQDIVALALASLNTLRTNNFKIRPLQMPRGLSREGRLRNPMGGFVPEVNATISFPVLGP